jgi:hypothetical protein
MNNYCLIIPRISKNNQLSYDNWLLKFNNELNNIIEEYIKFFNYITKQKGLVYSLNINELNTQLKKLIYYNSYNRYKYYQELI